MIETPLYGRFQGENKRLVFIAPAPYHVLVRTCLIGGAIAALWGFFGPPLGVDVPFLYPAWWFMVGTLVFLAGLLAAFALQSISFDLRERHYRRRQGPGLFPTTTHGSINDLDAVVLIAEPNSRMLQGGVTYHLVLHWKSQKEPSMVLQQDTRALSIGAPLNSGAVHLLNQGIAYARALGLPFYDNSHFASPNPMPVWR